SQERMHRHRREPPVRPRASAVLGTCNLLHRPISWCTFRAHPFCVKIFGMTDPIERYIQAADRARQQGVDTAPMALATADAHGQPSVRVVLLRHVDQRGFVFFTNYGSRKARE